MKYFKLIDGDVDPKPILAEIDSVQDAWALSTGRQDKIAVQREALAIPLIPRQVLVKHPLLMKIAAAWLITVPASGALAACTYFMIRGFMLP